MRRPGVRRVFSALLAASATGCGELVEPNDCELPSVLSSSVTAGTRNVLSALVRTHVRSADSIFARFGPRGSALDSVTAAVAATGITSLVPVLGLKDASQYDVQVVASSDCGTDSGDVLPFETGTLPPDLPRYTGGGTDPSPGYVAFAVGNYGIVIDNTGRIVWYHRFTNGAGLNFQPQPTGRYAARPNPDSAGAAARWVEIDPLGEVRRTLTCARGLPARVHDMLAESDGSYWLLCDEARTVDLSRFDLSDQAMVLGTGIQHLSASGTLLFEWTPFDHLEVDPRDIEPGDKQGTIMNWTHGNSLDVDADGNVIVSFRNLSQVVKIHGRTGEVLWRMGGTRNQFAFESDSSRPFARQHGVRTLGSGRLQLLDNLGDPSTSRAERYEYDEARRTVRLTGAYTSSSRAVAHIGGTTQALPGGRILVSYGNGASVEEYDANGNVVWRLDGNPGYVFRAHRIRSLYHPGAGDPR